MSAQTNTTSLNGTVADPSGALMSGAVITALNPATGLSQTARTGAKGDYAFDQIPPGKYSVTVTASGFSDQTRTVELLVNSPVKMNFTLSVGAVEVVNVETSANSVNTSDATLGKPFDSTQIQTLPYLANNVLSLLSLQPGVMSLAPTAGGGVNTDTRSGSVNGARQDQTNVTLDGVDNNDQNLGYAFTGVLRSTRDSVEEFRVVTSGANADSGRSSGAQVSLVTRSGTNALHGSAYEYYRDPGVSSNDWFIKQSQLSSGKPNVAQKILQHTYGGSLGGPIRKDKLFFFGAYEGYKQASDQTVTNVVPSIQGGGGLVTGSITYLDTGGNPVTLSPTQIAGMDPNCTQTGTCPLGPGTNPAAIAYFKQFPTANSNAVGDGYNTGGYVFSSPAPLSNITNIIRLDYNMSSKQLFFVRGNLQSDNQLSPLQFPGGPPNTNTYGNSKGIAAGHIWTISDRLINNARYGYIREGTTVRGATNQPYVTFSALTNLTSTNTSSILLVPTHDFIDDLTFITGRHTIQVGVNDRLIFNNRQADNTLYSVGNVTSNDLTVGAIAGEPGSLDADNFGYPQIGSKFKSNYNTAIADVTGLLTHATAYYNFAVAGNALAALPAGTLPARHYKSFEQEYYVQDAWKVTPRLTLTAGLRYTYLGTPYETRGQEVAPTSSLHAFFQNRVSGMSQGISDDQRISFGPAGSANGKPNLWTAQKKNFAPRLAFAYATPDNHTSIRGGFALAYDHFGEGVIDEYDQNGAFGLSTRAANGVNQYVDTAPRFSGYHTVPTSIIPAVAGAGSFPVTPPDGSGNVYYSLDDHLQTPYAETFNLTLQHEMHSGLTLSATYTGRLGRHLLMNNDLAMPLNLTDTSSGSTYFQATTALDKMVDQGVDVSTVSNMAYWQNMFPNATFKTSKGVTYKGTQAVYLMTQANRGNETATLDSLDSSTSASPSGQSYRYFHPQFASLYAQSTIGTSNYHGLQLSLRQTLKHGIQWDFNYTLSKSMDMGSSPERGNSTVVGSTNTVTNTVANSFSPSAQYGVSDFDARHNITADWIAPLPFGKNSLFGSSSNRLVDALIGGWVLDGLLHYSSGLPFSSVDGLGWATNWDVLSYNVQTGPVVSGGHHHYLASTHSENAFADPVAAAANIRAPYAGETGQRNNYRGDGYMSLDSGLSKSFNTFEGQSLKISVEGFNVLNSVRFNDGSSTTMVTNGFSSSYGKYSALLTQPRQMQFSGRYYF
ncbi:MAG TPA: carboxypeptidase-like regulatory domain-containing protein [Granulicella sp.]|jgi:hypothetical protein|nr:carboxypeptidase-like regulatory domain-containing protein [Granulicella sp.]